MLQAGGQLFAYEPVLRALQARVMPPALEQYLAAQPMQGAAVAVEPPPYLALGRVRFDLTLLIDERKAAAAGAAAEELKAGLADVDLLDVGALPRDALLQLTTLDPSQVHALLMSLSQRIALIQGPPGCGKTYIGIHLVRLLLANTQPRAARPPPARQPPDAMRQAQAAAAKPIVGPIVCVTFTNHALDQFLEGLLDAGITDIVRVGGRSKSERLQQLNLFSLSCAEGTRGTPSQRWVCHQQYEAMEKLDKQLKGQKGLLDRLQRVGMYKYLAWRDLSNTIWLTARDLHRSMTAYLDEQTADGFTSTLGDMFDVFKHWSTCADINQTRKLQDAVRKQDKASGKGKGKGKGKGTSKEHQQGMRFDVLASAADEDGGSTNTAGVPSSSAADPVMEEEEGMQRPLDLAAVLAWQEPASDRPLEELLRLNDAWGLSRVERQRLLAHWRAELLPDLHRALCTAIQHYMEASDSLRQAQNDMDLLLLRRARVIGMTTSGMAAKQKLIRAVGAKIIVCEEAAEVLEAHVLASLTPQAEHLILVGDHEQLRPKVDAYELSIDSKRSFNLDLSLFERLVRQNSFPVATLALQHRMRPAISDLIRSTIYPQLQDHESVLQYDEVRGMDGSLYFMTHEVPEGGADDETSSKYNDHEVQLVVGLTKYLIQQGYTAPEDIAVLTPYLGQLARLRRALAAVNLLVAVGERDAEQLVELEADEADRQVAGGRQPRDAKGAVEVSLSSSVRITTIDNFQGEEATVVIISLVRSNSDNNVGFVKSRNRTNVLLSRAKHGMYIIGNAACLEGANGADMWHQVLRMLREHSALGDALRLRCQNHGELTCVRNGDGFDAVADGGCARSCGARLECGHSCPRMCHADDPNHTLHKCRERCARLQHPCQHPCTRMCGEEPAHEGACSRRVDVELPCGHTAHKIECYRAQNPAALRCSQQVRVDMACGHTVTCLCCDRDTYIADPSRCPAACAVSLACGHPCPGTCGFCQRQTAQHNVLQPEELLQQLLDRAQHTHAACSSPCGRNLNCGHSCSSSCHEAAGRTCPPCTQPCVVACAHSKCRQRCAAECAPCAKACGWRCTHEQGRACSLPCGAPCDRLPCDLRCNKLLECGHRCPLVCSEACPSAEWCTVCGSTSNMVHDLIMLQDVPITSLLASELDEEPLLLLPCDHAFPCSSMDGHMGLGDAYARGDSGAWLRPQPQQSELGAVKACPMCRSPIVRVARYGRIINSALLGLMSGKYLAVQHKALGAAEEHYNEVTAALEAASAGGEQQAVDKALKSATQLLQQFRGLQRKAERPPTHSVYEAAKSALLHAMEQGDGAAEDGGSSSADARTAEMDKRLQLLHVRHPDMRPVCAALLGCGRTHLVLAELKALCVAVLSTGFVDGDEVRVEGAKRAVNQAQEHFRSAERCMTRAANIAAQHSLMRQQAQALHVQAQLRMSRCIALERQNTRLVAAALGISGGASALRESTRARQAQLLDDAEEWVRRAAALLQQHGLEGQERKAVQALLAQLPLLRDKLQDKAPPESTLEEIIHAVKAADWSLNNEGYNGSGHAFYCPNGHLYFIGECGGATQTARCADCGAAIGGGGHRLHSNNRRAEDVQRILEAGRR